MRLIRQLLSYHAVKVAAEQLRPHSVQVIQAVERVEALDDEKVSFKSYDFCNTNTPTGILI